MNSPWGKADSVNTIARGIHWVSTPGHGGLMIATGVARKLLSEAARKQGTTFGGYLAYEEDCQYAIAVYELKETIKSVFLETITEQGLLKSLSTWNADYLIERGITPSQPEYTYYLDRQEQQKLRDEKNPDYIISASGNDDGTVDVTTADGAEHKVSGTSYALTREAGKYRLSACEVING